MKGDIEKMFPIGDNIILKPMYPEDKTKSGLILASGGNSELVRQVYPDRGVVLVSKKSEFKEGEVVVFNRFGSNIINDGNIEYYVVPVCDIIAKIEEN